MRVKVEAQESKPVQDMFIRKKKIVMTIEEYKAQPFKYDGNPVPISEIWGWLTRNQRREITTLVHKGKNPDITNYI